MSTPDLAAARSLSRLVCPKGQVVCTHPGKAGLLCGCEYGKACARWLADKAAVVVGGGIEPRG